MAANTQPIYTGEIVSWSAKLTNQIAPKILTNQSLVLLGNTGDYGMMIYNIRCHHLGNNAASVVRFWTRPTTSTAIEDYSFLGEMSWGEVSTSTESTALPAVDGKTALLYDVPIFDGTVKAIHLSKNLNLYCALGTAVSFGVQVRVFGGLYSIDT